MHAAPQAWGHRSLASFPPLCVCFNICLGIIYLFMNYTLIIYDKFDLIKFIGCIYNTEQLFFLGGDGGGN